MNKRNKWAFIDIYKSLNHINWIYFKINFNSYINDLRIKEAVRLITNQEHLLYTVDGLAEKSGFGNRVSFTSAFKKHTGVSPSVFIKNTKH